MLEIQSVSSVGVGTYRMSSSSTGHLEALKTAIQQGYNLIDTATNYCQGTSETLVGTLFQQHPEYKEHVFVVSKVGYVPAQAVQSAALTAFLQSEDLSIAHIDTDFEYSLDPAFIAFQLEQSLAKIGRNYLDVYLLHNPERLLQSQNLNQVSDLYDAIGRAFAFLETQVVAGKIRYYGISSNDLFDPNKARSIDCTRVLQIAEAIQLNHHFKFLQFPFNFKERDALQPHYEGHSLLEWANANGLVTMGNRPLNMADNGLEFRLVTHEAALQGWDRGAAAASLADFVGIVDAQIRALTQNEQTAQDFEPMRLLQQHFEHFQGREAVERFFAQQVVPFMQVVFEDNPILIQAPLQTVQQHTLSHALNNQTQRTLTFLEGLQEEGIAIKDNAVLTACHAYLDHFGLDHVLVGLRRPAYVYALQQSFTTSICN